MTSSRPLVFATVAGLLGDPIPVRRGDFSSVVAWVNELAATGSAEVHLFAQSQHSLASLLEVGLEDTRSFSLTVHEVAGLSGAHTASIAMAAEAVHRATLLHGVPTGILWIAPSLTRACSTVIRRRFDPVPTFLHSTRPRVGLADREVDDVRDLVAQLTRLG